MAIGIIHFSEKWVVEHATYCKRTLPTMPYPAFDNDHVGDI